MNASQISNVITFPRPMKRGRKVRTGPRAEVIALPSADDLLFDVASATDPIAQLIAVMNWERRKYGANRPAPGVAISEMLADMRGMAERHAE